MIYAFRSLFSVEFHRKCDPVDLSELRETTPFGQYYNPTLARHSLGMINRHFWNTTKELRRLPKCYAQKVLDQPDILLKNDETMITNDDNENSARK